MSFLKVIFLACFALAVNAQTNYDAGNHGRSETVSPDGEVQGQYQYTGDDGKLITVKYRAGKEGFQVEGDHLPKAPEPQQQPQYNPQQQQPQYNPQFQQPQYNPQQFQQPAQYNPQQLQQPAQYNPQQFQQPAQYNPQQFQQPAQYNPHQFQQPQQQQLPTPQLFPQNFGQQQFQQPNPVPGQYQQPVAPLPQPQYYDGQQQGQYRPSKVSVSQQPGAGFTYNIES